MMRSAVLVFAMSLATAATAAAQSAGRFEVSGGAVFAGGIDLGVHNAELTANTGTTGAPSTFFRTESTLKPAIGVQGRVGYSITRAFAIEGGAQLTWPVFQIRATGDIENAANVSAEETLSHYLFDASAVWHFGDAYTRRTVPFVYGGAGYFRELHDGATLIEDGIEYHAGGGLKWWFGSAPGRFGIRAEAGVSIRDGGFDPDGDRHLVPVAGGSLLWRF
jgi:hypothetical protein